MNARRHVALFLLNFSGGGIERVSVNLANELSRRGHMVEIVVAQARGPFLDQVDPAVSVISFDRSRAYQCLRPLSRYLHANRPDVLFSVMPTMNIVALAANMLAGSKSRVVPVEHMPVNVDRRENPNLLVKIAYGMYPIAYRFTPVVVVNCHDSAAAFRREFPGLAALVRVIYNPVVSTDLATLIDESIEEGPLASIENRPAVLLGAGRLTRQKNFALLLRAFALVRERRECELVIIGDRGEEKERLRRLAADLGVSQHLHWPGFVANPYAYFSRASIFVLSSIYETLPTVLVEAIACGTPAVATNCFGVNEILEGDRFGTIVEDFEPTTLAEAILATLDRPISREALKTGARKFSVSASADKYEALVQELMA